MIAGSLLWGGLLLLAFLVGTALLSLLLGKRRWVRDDDSLTDGGRQLLGKYISWENEEKRSRFLTMLGTFFHNIRAVGAVCLLALGAAFLGTQVAAAAVVFGLFTVLAMLRFLWVNGLMSAFAVVLGKQLRESMRLFLIGVLPHGVLELSAIYLLMGHSLWLILPGSCFVLMGSLAILTVAAVGLLVAAFLETYVTPRVYEKEMILESARS